MYIKNARCVAESEFGEHPDTYEVEVHASAACTDQQILNFVEQSDSCFCGGYIVERPSFALVRYYA